MSEGIVEPTESVESPVATATPVDPEPKAPAPAANPWDSPESAKAEIERLRRENGAARTNAKAQAAEEARSDLAQTIGKALGLVKDEPIDPAKLTESLTASQAEAKQARVELAVYQNASAAGGDPAALLDSSSFLKSLAAIDPSDTAAVQAAISTAIESNSRLGAATQPKTPAPNPAQGSSASGPQAVAQLTQADVDRLSRAGKHDEIVAAKSEGRLNTLLGIS